MSDKPAASRTSALPGLSIIALFIAGLSGIFRANSEPLGSVSGPLYLLMAIIAFGYLLHVCFSSR